MTDGTENVEFHFLDRDREMTGEDFLKQQLSLMLIHFSYDRLSGSSVDGLNERIVYYDRLRDDLYSKFPDPDTIWASPVVPTPDLYEPLTENQRMETIRVCDLIRGNFDKAREDAQDRGFERLGTLVSSVPLMGRMQGKL